MSKFSRFNVQYRTISRSSLGGNRPGQELFNDTIKDTDSSGNFLFKDIGLLLKGHIEKYFKEWSLDVRFKCIDPN
jgi:hypothetical protein